MAKVVLPRSLPRLLVHLFVRVFRGNDFFVHGQEKKEGWGEIYGSTCALDSSQILAFQLSGGGAVDTKVLNPWKHWHSNLGVLLPRTHCGLCPLLTDYLELFAFSTPWGFSSNWKTALYCKQGWKTSKLTKYSHLHIRPLVHFLWNWNEFC